MCLKIGNMVPRPHGRALCSSDGLVDAGNDPCQAPQVAVSRIELMRATVSRMKFFTCQQFPCDSTIVRVRASAPESQNVGPFRTRSGSAVVESLNCKGGCLIYSGS